jgi:hypothetical protein
MSRNHLLAYIIMHTRYERAPVTVGERQNFISRLARIPDHHNSPARCHRHAIGFETSRGFAPFKPGKISIIHARSLRLEHRVRQANPEATRDATASYLAISERIHFRPELTSNTLLT